MFGGYPAAAELVDDVERWQSFLRNSIIEPVLIKDILGLTTVGKPALFRQAFELAMAYRPGDILPETSRSTSGRWQYHHHQALSGTA